MVRNGLAHLSYDECLDRLSREQLGRVSVSIGALPAILPVNYALHGNSVIVRTAPGTKLSAALMGAVVGFEVDHVDADHNAGWSVLVVGHAEEIRDRQSLEEVAHLPLETWAPGTRDFFVRIPLEHMTGRAFGESSACR